jgi:hypothetical protein
MFGVKGRSRSFTSFSDDSRFDWELLSVRLDAVCGAELVDFSVVEDAGAD